MDEYYSLFLKEVGEPMFRQEVPPSSIESYRGKLPEKLLEYWAEHGWCGYGEGIFWTVNPLEYDGVLASLIEGTALEGRDTYHVIARGAFGDLYLCGEKTGCSVDLAPFVSRYSASTFDSTGWTLDNEVESFFLGVDREGNDFGDFFKPALKRLGMLAHDEMYGFVPALAFGGPSELANIEKVKTVEHLMLLSQISPLEPYGFSDY